MKFTLGTTREHQRTFRRPLHIWLLFEDFGSWGLDVFETLCKDISKQKGAGGSSLRSECGGTIRQGFIIG